MVSENEYRFALIVLMVHGAFISGEDISPTIVHAAAQQVFAARRTVRDYEEQNG